MRLVVDQFGDVRQIASDEAKTNLPRLLDEVARGETITITKHGVPVAVLTPPARSGTTGCGTVAGLRAFRFNDTIFVA